MSALHTMTYEDACAYFQHNLECQVSVFEAWLKDAGQQAPVEVATLVHMEVARLRSMMDPKAA